MTAAASSPARTSRVAVVGGGLAGLAAAVALAERGFAVDLYEARRKLGGRAGSFFDSASGQWIDHCQHVSMGCCTNLADFCQRVGIAEMFERHRWLTFLEPDGRQSGFLATDSSPPFHLAASFLRARFLTLRDRLSVGRALFRLARASRAELEDQTIGQWLANQRQSAAAIERFWAPVLVSALGETLDRSSLKLARKVFVDGFMTNRHGFEILLPRVPLAELYGERLEKWLAEHGVRVHLSTAVQSVAGTPEILTGLVLADGQMLPVDAAVVAVPWRRIGETIEAPLRAAIPNLDHFAKIDGSPITAVHLWFDRMILDRPYRVIVGTLAQWVFNRVDETARAAHGAKVCADTRASVDRGGPKPCELPDEPVPGAEFCYQVVISASRALPPDREQLVAQVVDELRCALCGAKRAQVLRSRVVTEPNSVFSCTPEVERLRPPQKTAISNLAIAGDWTQTGWPATMEGAVRSGYLAAEAILEHFGRKEKVIVDDLPVGRLARWLLKVR